MAKLLLILSAAAALAAVSAYQSEIQEWRKQREARLKADGGWLSVAGLTWLREGGNRFGKDAANEIVVPDGAARAGSFTLQNGKVTVEMDGQARAIAPDSSDVVKVGRVSLYVIKRGDKYGIRMKDPESPYRREFKGIEYFPAKESYRVTAKWVAAPKRIPILNIIGQTEMSENPGYAVFRLGGQELRLYPILEEPGAKELSFIFRDLTTGKATYPAGRFLDTELPKDGRVVLDFNKAYNPPCAFTAYATCPLPPKENSLPVAIEAGEKRYGH